jgi:hypothetical protein
MGKVSWTVFDACEVVTVIKTIAYLVPEGNIRLFSPQVYFQENGIGSGRLDKDRVELILADGTPMYFPLNKSKTLPFMIT